MDDYSRSSHVKYSLSVHMIFVTKYRKALFTDKRLNEDAKQFLYEASGRYGYKIITMETDRDYVHMLIQYPPKVPVSDVSKHLKQYSCIALRECGRHTGIAYSTNTGNTRSCGQTGTLRAVSDRYHSLL